MLAAHLQVVEDISLSFTGRVWVYADKRWRVLQQVTAKLAESATSPAPPLSFPEHGSDHPVSQRSRGTFG
jgi:hypothetical protein